MQPRERCASNVKLSGVLRTDALGSKVRIEKSPGGCVQDMPHGVPLDQG